MGAAIGGLLGMGGGLTPTASSASGPIASNPILSAYTPVQVNSTGLNLGEILKELNDAPPENGGYSIPGTIGFPQISSIPPASTVSNPLQIGQVTPYSGGSKKTLYLAGGGVALALLLWIWLR